MIAKGNNEMCGEKVGIIASGDAGWQVHVHMTHIIVYLAIHCWSLVAIQILILIWFQCIDAVKLVQQF